MYQREICKAAITEATAKLQENLKKCHATHVAEVNMQIQLREKQVGKLQAELARYVHCPHGHLCYASAEGTVVCEACRLQAEVAALKCERDTNKEHWENEHHRADDLDEHLAAERAQIEGLREALDRSMNALCGVYPYLPSERGDPELAQAISNADIIILPWVNRNEAT
jgi:hypothetical protein